MTDDRGPTVVEIESSGHGEAIRTVIDQVRTFTETLDADRRYQVNVQLRKVDDD
jgi:hypothetical protein